MPKKKAAIPNYKLTKVGGKTYYRTRITNADGKRTPLYGDTPEELHQKVQAKKAEIEEILYRRENPTVDEYVEKWLLMKSATVCKKTLDGYRQTLQKYLVDVIGDMYLDEVTADDLKRLMVPASQKSKAVYGHVSSLIKGVFRSALRSHLIEYDPAVQISARGGKEPRKKEALTDEQKKILIDTVRDLPPYLFVMIGLYSGLRREEILGLQWDCVFLDGDAPYIDVRRAWHIDNNRPTVDTRLKSKAARRNIPIPPCLVQCLRDAKKKSDSDFVISNDKDAPLTESQYMGLWDYIKVRSTEPRKIYKYINGERIVKEVHPVLGEHVRNNKSIVYTIDFHVTPHVLRYTYVTDLIYAGVDPKTAQYLAGHKSCKETMDIYCKLMHNRPQELHPVINQAFKKANKNSVP